MSQTEEQTVTLEAVRPEDMPRFIVRLQDTFTQAARKAFPEFPGTIPPQRDIEESLGAPGCEALQIVHDGQRVGGAIVIGDGAVMMLDFFFIDAAHQGKRLGQAAWQAIEARYPNAERWQLVTPYHEKRNIHFYVNRCGFHITEYFNEHHPNPDFPQEEAADYPGAASGLFKFEKLVGDAGR